MCIPSYGTIPFHREDVNRAPYVPNTLSVGIDSYERVRCGSLAAPLARGFSEHTLADVAFELNTQLSCSSGPSTSYADLTVVCNPTQPLQ